MAERSHILKKIGLESLLDVLPGLEELVLEAGQVEHFGAREVVAYQGRTIDYYTMPLDGGLRLKFSGGGAGNQAYLGYLKEGRSLALGELLRQRPYAYTAEADTAVTLLRIPRRRFLELIDRHPAVEHYLLLMTDSAGFRSFKRFLQEREVSQEQLFRVASHVPVETASLGPGQTPSNARPLLYFVDAGDLQIRSKPEVEPAFETAIGEGAWFGGEALVPPHETSYEVVARSESDFRYLRLAQARGLFEELGLIEEIFDEPWLQQLDEAIGASQGGELTELPGRPIDFEEAYEVGLTLDPVDIRRASRDEGSIAASMANIGTLLGIDVNLSSLETELDLLERVTPLRLAEILEPFGLFVSAQVVQTDHLSRYEFPALVGIGPRFAVLLGVAGESVYLLDPARGAVEMERAAFDQLWDGHLLEVARGKDIADGSLDESLVERPRSPERAAEQTPEERRSLTRRLFARLLGDYRPTLTNVLLLSLLAVGLGLLIPQFSEHILNEVLTLRDMTTVWVLVAGMGLTVLLHAAATFGQQWLLAEFSIRYDKKLTSHFYRKALRLPTSFYQDRKVGELLTRLGEIGNIRQFLSGSSLQALINLFSIVLYALVLWTYSWKIAAIGAGLLVALVLIRWFFKDRLRRNHEEAYHSETRAQSLISEQVSAMTTVKSQGAEEIMRKRWEEAFLEGVKRRRQVQIDSTSISGITRFLGSLTKLGGIYFAASLAMGGSLTPGAIMAVSMYMSSMIAPISKLAHLVSEWEDVKVSFEKVGDVFHARQEQTPESARTTHSLPLRGKIKLESVDFRYSADNPWVLREIDLTIYPNQVVAFVGRSGSGKTTLMKLIAGHLEPTAGRIFFDEFDRSFLSLDSIRKQVGFILQDNNLFSGSIAENIAYSDDVPDRTDIRRAARRAAASDFIGEFPQGYDHHLGEGGLGLSGGQKQRLAIARTLYRDPRIVLMDEATSALDADSEKAIVDNMKNILMGRTAIISAHRLSTIRNADRIVVLDEGRVVEDGSHDELLEREGYYAELFEDQLRSGGQMLHG